MGFWRNMFFGEPKEPEFVKNSITVPQEPDGTLTVDKDSPFMDGSIAGYGFALATLPDDEQETIKEYRKLALNAEVDEAIQEIVNESFVITNDEKAIKLTFMPECELSKELQEKILDVYEYVYHDLFNFDQQGAFLFRKFYVDSRLFIHKVMSKDQKRIVKLQVIDPLRCRRIRRSKLDQDGLLDLSQDEIMYIYSPRVGFERELWAQSISASFTDSDRCLIFPEQTISYIDSGITHPDYGYIIGHLAKAVVPYNNMKMMEDSMVIYRVVRSPARRVFYVDVSNLPKSKGEQYMQGMINKFRNKQVYNPDTGVIVDRKQVVSMLEDIWLPRSNGRSTEVSMLDEGSNVGVTEDVEYCRNTFYRSLNVPRSRFNNENMNPFSAGRVTEITRDEYRFQKFIQSLRNRFIVLIEDVLRTQLTLDRTINDKEWPTVKRHLAWIFSEDNQFVQLKQSEILENKLELLQRAEPYTEKYLSNAWVMKHVFKFSDAEIETLEQERAEEKSEREESSDPSGNDFLDDYQDDIPKKTSSRQNSNDDEDFDEFIDDKYDK